jgi:predicted nucleic acid-binding Zn ribbon protein
MAPAIKKCPTCGKNKVRRLIGPGAGLIFKGSGFYITDYRSEGYKNAAKGDTGATEGAKSDSKAAESTTPASSESKPSSPTTGESKSKTESKPAVKSDSKKRK